MYNPLTGKLIISKDVAFYKEAIWGGGGGGWVLRRKEDLTDDLLEEEVENDNLRERDYNFLFNSSFQQN